jgi:hypothetical protein
MSTSGGGYGGGKGGGKGGGGKGGGAGKASDAPFSLAGVEVQKPSHHRRVTAV